MPEVLLLEPQNLVIILIVVVVFVLLVLAKWREQLISDS